MYPAPPVTKTFIGIDGDATDREPAIQCRDSDVDRRGPKPFNRPIRLSAYRGRAARCRVYFDFESCSR